MTSPSWRRAFEPLPREHGFEPLEVEGAFPPDLRGTLYRVGPGSFAAGGEPFGHWFDGDGAVSAVRLGEGTVEGACRFVDARERAVEQRLGRRAFRGFGTEAPYPTAARVKQPVNVGALWWGGELYALGEGASPHALDTETLLTRGPSDLGGALRSAFAAHPHRVDARQAAYNFGVRHGRRFEIDLLELPDNGPARLLCTVPLRSPRYLHDFAVTERRAVFVLPPLEADLDALLGGSGSVASAFRWRADAATEILIVELDPPHRASWSEADPFFAWHLASATELGDGLQVELVRYPDFAINEWYGALPYREPAAAPVGTLARMRVGTAARAKLEPMSDVSCELPVAARASIVAVARTATAPPGAPHDAVVSVDRERGEARWFFPGPDRYPSGEPCTAGGYLLSLAYDARQHRSGLVAFDLDEPGAGPVATAWFAHHIPFAFHGTWARAQEKKGVARPTPMTTFHFDLRNLPDLSNLVVDVRGATFDLQTHDASTLKRFQGTHPTLNRMAIPQLAALTHFAEVKDDQLREDDGISWVRVLRPPAGGARISQVVRLALHVPRRHLRALYRERFRLYAEDLDKLRAHYRANLRGKPRLYGAKLHGLGFQDLPTNVEHAIDTLVGAQDTVTSLDTAAALVAHTPELATAEPYATTLVLHEHILPDPEVDPDQYNAMKRLAKAIEGNPNWSPVVPCKDKDGKPITAEYELDGFKPGDALHTYGLAPEVLDAIPAATAGARRTASDDLRLRNRTWSPSAGTATQVREEAGRTQAPMVRAGLGAGPQYKWTVDLKTTQHGISVDEKSLKLGKDDAFSIDASNSYARTLYVGYELFDTDGKSLGKANPLQSISATNSILGIPCWTDPTSLGFALQGAASARLYFGSLGTTNWVEDFSLRGALLTGFWQYGVPLIFMAAGKGLESTQTFNKIVSDPDLVKAAMAIGFGLVGGAVPTAAALLNTKMVLTSFGDIVLSFILKKGMEELGKWLVTEAGKGAILSALGPVGWLFRIAAVAMNVEAMAITTGEVLSSPACVTVKVSRAIDVSVKVGPDPLHGEAGDSKTAVWPAVATRYAALLQSRNGTGKKLEGEMGAATGGAPLNLLFTDVPAGGDFRILFGVYSAKGWLAGAWQSDWTKAVPNNGTTLEMTPGTIEEKLVPLTPDAQYEFKEKLAWDGKAFRWDAGKPPTSAPAPSTTRTALNCGDNGGLCDLVGLTLNNSGFQVGMAWRASGQGLHPDDPSIPTSDRQLFSVRSLSVLAEPGKRLKTTSVGFTDRPAIAYSPSFGSKDAKERDQKKVDQMNFVLDPRKGGMHLRQVVLGEGTDFGFGEPKQKSWGRFPLENVDALVVHHSDTVIAASWKEHKLMLLSLPEAAVDDDKAPEALMVSGMGIREGLMQGPRALAVAPDGRLLVLESGNIRVQAFDTKGNPAPSFTTRPDLFTIPTSDIAADLAAGKLSEAFHAAHRNALRPNPTPLPASLAPLLDAGSFKADPDPLRKALAELGIVASFNPDDPGGRGTARITVVAKGREWIISDPRGEAWHLIGKGAGIAVWDRLEGVKVREEKAGERWLVVDPTTGMALRIEPSTADKGISRVRPCQSWFPLTGMRGRNVTFDDMAVEAQGYVYVISHIDDGSKPTDYLLDVYGPDGAHVLRTPDPSATDKPQNVVAGRIAVDIFRNLYGLTFETLRGPGGRPQPGLAHWTPTTPDYTFALSLQQALNEPNIGVVKQAFLEKGVTLSNDAFVRVVNREGAWEIKDGTTLFHAYRSEDGIQVFKLSA